MNAQATICAMLALCLACAAGVCATLARSEIRKRAERREKALGLDGREEASAAERAAKRDLQGWVLRYVERLTRRLYTGATEPIAPSVRMRRCDETRAGIGFRELIAASGYAKRLSVMAYCEARLRLGFAGACAGALLGVLFSSELAVLLGVAGAVAGCMLPGRALKRERARRAAVAERHLSEMLEVLALGLRSGLSFDLSFALYGMHFEGEFAQSCVKAYRSWTLGLLTREEALRELAASYDCGQLRRVIDSVVRSLRFGSVLTGILEEAAAQSRAVYRAALEERVAKAPVKMMLPTGMLILPAMLLLVMGPVLLELMGGF